MKKLIPVIPALLICFASFGQSNKSIEISLTGRYDVHGNYVSNFAGRAYNDTNTISGLSYGINGVFRHRIIKSYSLSLGVGFYQLRADKVKGNLPFNIPGTRTARNIDYDDGRTNLLYSTTQYHYNNLAISVALDKEFKIKTNFKFNIAAEFIGYKTLSQKYRLFSGSDFYNTSNNKPLEFGVNLNAGVIKEYKKFYLRPSLILPIYQNLKGDKVFFEDSKMNISKWLNGIGLSFKIGKYF
jgi:hypothetical protein